MDKPPASASTTTTFIQADATTFKELVQRLTGPAESTTTASTVCSPPSSSSSSSSLPACRLKRLHHGSHLRLAIPRTDAPSGSTKLASPAAPSPAATFARLDISAEEKSGEAIEEAEDEEEERAIKERRFYLYPSPRAKNRVAEPELLPLFPITSPRAAAGEP
ncbi:VQ motif-containing protein 31-like [Zingiber officinale]|uniref:VQ domain-containing protein n=1 Tax=Zingiber officinale TaxID=94328 RepID=A0A8J5I619_ZINOF|nr:VQ motif-containing protein 31-like [Zingiber officinale]KAG6536604.1 hypothetical protein ZIOFF_001662 [Zingiber officinale]